MIPFIFSTSSWSLYIFMPFRPSGPDPSRPPGRCGGLPWAPSLDRAEGCGGQWAPSRAPGVGLFRGHCHEISGGLNMVWADGWPGGLDACFPSRGVVVFPDRTRVWAGKWNVWRLWWKLWWKALEGGQRNLRQEMAWDKSPNSDQFAVRSRAKCLSYAFMMSTVVVEL